MKSVLYILIGLVVVFVVIFAIGSILPQDHTVVGIREFGSPSDQLWQTITNVRQYPAWRTEVAEIHSRTATGDSLSWKEIYLDGDVLPFVVVRSHRPQRWMIRIANDNLPFSGSWTYDLTETETGCKLQITEKGSIGSPFLRFFWRLFIDQNERVELILDDLETTMTNKPSTTDSIQTTDSL